MPECQNIEWKRVWKDDYLAWICAFANADGGKLYIGCDDNGNVIGLQNAHKLMEDIPNKVRDTMGIVVNVNLLKENDKEYIEIDVSSYPIGISYKGLYYIRSGSTRQVLTGSALETFLLHKRGATWDRQPLPAFTFADIDDSVVEHFKQWAAKRGRVDAELLNEPKEILMDKLNLMNGSYLTNAAMLLFSKNPEKWQTGAFIKIGFFETNSELLYQDEIHGSLLEQIDSLEKLIYQNYLKAKITYDGMQRIERYFIPKEALREALLNAVCHKQYQSGVPIQISVYCDKLYIANSGELPNKWTIKNLKNKHPSKPYNPAIAYVFNLAGFIESWGRGIAQIFSACSKEGLPIPEYEINPDDIMIKFTAPADRIIHHFKDLSAQKIATYNLDNTNIEIINLLSEDPAYTSEIISEKLALSRKTISKRITSLKERGIISRVGSDRKGYWKLMIQTDSDDNE